MKLSKCLLVALLSFGLIEMLFAQDTKQSEKVDKLLESLDIESASNLDFGQLFDGLKGPVVNFFSKLDASTLSRVVESGIEVLKCVDTQLKSESGSSSVKETMKRQAESTAADATSKSKSASAAASAFASASLGDDMAEASTDPSLTQPSSTLVDLLLESAVSCAAVKLGPTLLELSSLVLSTEEVSKVDAAQDAKVEPAEGKIAAKN